MFEFRRIRNAVDVLRGKSVPASKAWLQTPPPSDFFVFDNTPGDMVHLGHVREFVFYDEEDPRRVRASGRHVAGQLVGFDPASGRPIVRVRA